MLALTLPKIFFNIWFWFAIMAVIIIIHYFWGKTPPPPRKPGKFYLRHKKTITRIMDIFLIAIILFGWFSVLFMFFSQAFEPIFKPSPYIPFAENLKHAFYIFFIPAIPISGISGVLVGLLSVFQSNLTKVKRIILLIISLLPIAFTTLLLLIEPSAKHWSIIKLGLSHTAGSWIINGPAILIGKHFIPVSWNIMRKLRWVSGDYPG